MFKVIGKSLEVKYETGYHFKVDYLTENKLRWTSLAQRSDGAPMTGEETCYLHQQTNDIATVSWIEDTGITVSQNLDLAKMEVYAFMTWSDKTARGGRAALAHKGWVKYFT